MDKPTEVLVVEDEEAVGRVLETALRHYGLSVRLARGGHEAVAAYERHRDVIGLVLLDVRMPGLDGPATLAALQRLNPAVRAVFMSGSSGEYSSEELRRRGALRVLQKPFRSLAEVACLLAGLLD